jgi:1D-myo-inositol 3-kinase
VGISCRHLRLHYTTVGHVTIDVLDDGSRRPGGTAFYSALQAARLGWHASILTSGVAREIQELMEPYRDELELEVLPASHTTTLRTRGAGATRRQSLLAWAGPIVPERAFDSSILHLAPVARETPTRWRGRPAFVGLTAQGLARRWSERDGQIELAAPQRAAELAARRCHAIVVSEQERASCASLIASATAGGALVAITAGERPNTILEPGARAIELEVPAIERAVDDLGAGDVFAAALFVALAEGRATGDAVGFANAAAAVRVQGAGAGAIGERSVIHARQRAASASHSG